jgi:hypothetical protein
MVVGGLIGVFVGLAFGGNPKWRVWDYVFGPEEPEDGEEGWAEPGQCGSLQCRSEPCPRSGRD